MTSTSSTPRRSKRSTTNLADLRLAPLSTKFAEPPRDYHAPKSPHEDSPDISFSRQHSSYLQGKSAPTTPGILSRSSSRKLVGGGLSRRGSLYDEFDETPSYEYAAVKRDVVGNTRVDIGSGQIPKAKSEAALVLQQRLQGQNIPGKRKRVIAKASSGTVTPRVPKGKHVEDDWLTRAGVVTSALLQESKGQSWLASRESSTSLVDQASEDDDDQYEEMAALSASTARLHIPQGTLSPSSTRRSNWGSRYGSRTGSRKTSRRGSVTSTRTPVAGIIPGGGGDVIPGYFDEEPLAFPEPDFVDEDGGDSEHDEAEVARLTQQRSFGLGSLVDKLMGFNLFKVDEHEESSEHETEKRSIPSNDIKSRQQLESTQADKDDSASAATAKDGGGKVQEDGGWNDAAWLMSVASKAMFQ